MLIVMKFGGSSLATPELVENAANIIATKAMQGNRVVAVVSAQGKTTDELVKRAERVCPFPPPREADVLLSTGEQASMSIMAIKLHELGQEAVSLCGWQAGIHTDSTYGNAGIIEIDTARIQRELEHGRIVIVAGFQGKAPNDDITTLGRGGSDTTAIALSAALRADACYIYTDVSGIYSANPNVAKDAVKHDELSYDEMLEMSNLGAKVLHNRSVNMAKLTNVSFEVRSSFTDTSGTTVHSLAQKKAVSGIVADDHISMVTISGIKRGASTCKLFSLLAKNGVPVDVIIRSQLSEESRGTVSFSVSDGICLRVIELLNDNKSEIGYDKLTLESNLAKLSAVGSGLSDSCLVASMMLAELNRLGIDPHYITTGEIRISVIIPRGYAEDGEIALTKLFFSQPNV